MKEIHTEIEINASAEKVWRVLTDFAAYPEWNPFVRRVEGDLVVGYWLPGLFDGEHLFSIEPLGDGRVRFVQRERFKGLLVPFLARMLDGGTRRGFEEMNRALKLRAEEAP